MELGRLLVDKEGVRDPDEVDVLSTHHQLTHPALAHVKPQSLVSPELPAVQSQVKTSGPSRSHWAIRKGKRVGHNIMVIILGHNVTESHNIMVYDMSYMGYRTSLSWCGWVVTLSIPPYLESCHLKYMSKVKSMNL